MNYIILDLEATCWQERGLKQKSEIIEIGALRVNKEQGVDGSFAEFVRPFVHPQLSPFCQQLTTITQEQVDGAAPFPEVIARFQEWMPLSEPYVLCSWGSYDRQQLSQDCQLHGLPTDWLQSHISLKHQHATIRELRRPMGMVGALQLEGISLEGTHHRGIDDARNITRIFQKYMGQWVLPADPAQLF